MKSVTTEDIKGLSIPPAASHKGQNGRLLIIGGSHLFHAASLWALTVASRIVDLVHYSSVPENNELMLKIKSEFRDGIVVPRDDLDAYIGEDDCILIGPGMTRDSETKELTDGLLKKYPHKQWVIDAGALQMMDVSLIPKNAILTPHHGEFEQVFGIALRSQKNLDPSSVSLSTAHNHNTHEKVNPDEIFSLSAHILSISKKYDCIVLLKGQEDIACPPAGGCRLVEGGNAGMTKGGTGDVLAGLIAALACKNDPFLATIAGSFINKQAGDTLYRRVGPYFNASDLAHQIPLTMKELLIS